MKNDAHLIFRLAMIPAAILIAFGVYNNIRIMIDYQTWPSAMGIAQFIFMLTMGFILATLTFAPLMALLVRIFRRRSDK